MRASEEQLHAWMTGGLDGDSQAYTAFLRALAPLLRSFFSRRMSGAAGDVEDLVQESLMAVHARRGSYDRSRPLSAWAYAVARHKMIDHFRKNRRDISLESLEDILAAEGFEDACAARMDIGRLLGSLPAKQARAIRQTKVEGMSIAEAAGSGGISEADVKISVHRGLRALAMRINGAKNADR